MVPCVTDASGAASIHTMKLPLFATNWGERLSEIEADSKPKGFDFRSETSNPARFSGRSFIERRTRPDVPQANEIMVISDYQIGT